MHLALFRAGSDAQLVNATHASVADVLASPAKHRERVVVLTELA
jgi:hypothetical protein